ncbi:MAG: biopolymer transporter ExbD [Gammaproteobacteria bacterium]|nr:MAG: biopolymer transporter ExbD [Gammaproteobacteria bacterium]
MKPFETINVIPFIDIMLVLLAIVLTTASFITQGKIKIDLPNGDQSQTEVKLETIEIKVTPNGDLFYQDNPTTLSALDSTLEGLNLETPLLLKIDKQANFEGFIEILNLTKRYHLNNIAIATHESSSR